jgi:hypothetical protein
MITLFSWKYNMFGNDRNGEREGEEEEEEEDEEEEPQKRFKSPPLHSRGKGAVNKPEDETPHRTNKRGAPTLVSPAGQVAQRTPKRLKSTVSATMFAAKKLINGELFELHKFPDGTSSTSRGSFCFISLIHSPMLILSLSSAKYFDAMKAMMIGKDLIVEHDWPVFFKDYEKLCWRTQR